MLLKYIVKRLQKFVIILSENQSCTIAHRNSIHMCDIIISKSVEALRVMINGLVVRSFSKLIDITLFLFRFFLNSGY